MINDIDETIKALIIRELDELGLSFPQQYDISFETPGNDWQQRLSKLTINLYLFDMVENHALRDNSQIRQPQPDRRVTIRKPPSRFDCRYLVTTWSNATPADTELEHLLLGQALWALFRNPIIPEEFWAGFLKELDFDFKIPTQTAQPNQLDLLAQFWSSLENPWKGSFTYMVTMPLDLGKPIFKHPIVTTKMPFYQQSKDGNGST